MSFTRNGLIIAREIPTPWFRRTDDSPLLIPSGGITLVEAIREQLGMEVLLISDDIHLRMCVVKGRSKRKQHLIPAQDLPLNNSVITPMCGNTIKGWSEVKVEEEGLHICTKADYADGGKWCSLCVQKIRKVIKDAGAADGRATHISLLPVGEEIAAAMPPGERENAMYLFANVGRHNFRDPEFEYCNECRPSTQNVGT